MPARSLLLSLFMALPVASPALAQCPPAVPAQGAALPGPLPLFPAGNWWNLDVGSAPVDPASASYIAFINNGGTRRLHPDFGGEAAPGGTEIYGMPYVVVNGTQPRIAVTFQYASESDGVDASGRGVPFYPIPTEAATQPHWVEGGAPGNVDQRNASDRHLLIVDCARRELFELYNVWYSMAQARWYAGSGAFFALDADTRRPDGWTSADAAGLAILPGLVRYDEAWDPAITEIRHALRVTVRATNGYVFPASHRAGSTSGALPMGARLRLKALVAGQDPVLRTGDPNVRKIFRAMQRYGLIVADNGSDLYVTGTFDKRWNNDILNPAFGVLTASDFEVVKLGWNPAPAPSTLAGLALLPAHVKGGVSFFAVVTLAAPAPAGGAEVSLASSDPSRVMAPATVTVPAGASSAKVMVATRPARTERTATLTATLPGSSRAATLALTLR
jgi:hypothetical protein